MNATTTVTLLAVFGLGAAVGIPGPQGKEKAAGPPPTLADVLKGYVGQDCWYETGSSGFYWLRFTPVAASPQWTKSKLELVGQDFLKLANELAVPLSQLAQVNLRRP